MRTCAKAAGRQDASACSSKDSLWWRRGAAVRRCAGLALLAGLVTVGCFRGAGRRETAPAETVAGESEAGAAWAAGELPAGAMWVDTLDLSRMDQEQGAPHAGRSVDNSPLTLTGQVYTHGIGTHANSEMTIDLKGVARRFQAAVGLDDGEKGLGSIVFVVLVDGKEVRRSHVLHGGDPPETISVDLSGARQMTLVVEDADDDIDHDHADWAAAMLVLVPDAQMRPEAIGPPPDTPPMIAKGERPEPAIHAPRITGGTPGRPFLFRIPASGAKPLRYAAKNLPPGLTLDPATGIISGALQAEGTTAVQLTVAGLPGRATATLTIVGGPDALALTPPMGWNSWNVWGTAVDDAKVRAAAEWLVQSGLTDYGYQYVNIDDAWEGARDAAGRIQPNEKFPDMKALADYVHSLGLKLGLYSSPGPKTCAGYEGSYQHERLDAETYAAWGVDLLKYDWCSYHEIAQDPSPEDLRCPYEVMREALAACGRDIVYSLCQYGMGNVSTWGAEVGGHYWRTTGDIGDQWSSLSGIGFGQSGLEAFAGPGHWNDPDMLVVGQLGWGPNLHPTRLTQNEQVTHITLWSLLAAPLLIGCDLSQLDEFTLALLTNPEVLEVSQDPLGRQARRIVAEDKLEVWARPLANGTRAVGLFNRGRAPARVTANWRDLGLSGPQQVRNLWLRRDVGTFDEAYSATVARHGAVMLRVGTPGGRPARGGS
jgi:alpha-galactosidase